MEINNETVEEFFRLLRVGRQEAKTNEERHAFIERHNLDDYSIAYNNYTGRPYSLRGKLLKNASPRGKHAFDNVIHEALATFLFRSEDVGSERKLEHPHYRDESEFYKSEKSMIKIEDLSHGDTNGDEALSIILDNAVRFNNYDELIDIELLPKKVKMSIVKHRKYMFSDSMRFGSINSYSQLKIYIDNFIESVYSECRDEMDEALLNMYCDGFTIREIASKVGTSKSNVHKRLNILIK